MNALAQLHFLRPLWLLALPLAPLLAWWWWTRRRRESAWRRHVDAHLLPHLLEGGGARAHGGALVLLVAQVLAILALAGPSWRLGEEPLWRSRTPLVVAFDLSSAMLASDLPPSRLLQARAKLATLLRERAGGQVGLVAFADDAFTVAPLTEDTGNIALFLDALAPDVMPVDGQRADRAIAWSARLLEQAGFDQGDVLLVTDHAGREARRAAEAAARAGFRVSVLGVGTAAGAPYRTADGAIAQARLDPASLASVARAGGGRYQAMRLDDADLRALGVLEASQADGVAAQGEAGRRWRDEGYWLLPPLMLLALFAFRRGAGLAALLCIALLPWPAAHAQQATPWRRADQAAHARMEAGERAYRAGDYARAAQAFAGIDSADAHYNRGNALARQGAYAQAIAAYDQALRAQPGMADAVANRRAVLAAMQRKPPPGKGSKQDPGKQDGSAKAPPQQADAGSPGAEPTQGGAGQPKPGADARANAPQSAQAAQATPPPRAPADAAAQRDADAAQRERMRQALQARAAQRDRRDGKPAPARAETPAERERRLANEAWLRRVPDDPGGLLRAKFRLEHERRQQGGSE